MNRGIILVAAVGCGLAVWAIYGAIAPSNDVAQDVLPADETGELVNVIMPELEPQLQIGARAFAAKCAACHGPSAGGIDGAGPPLIHKIYEPSHHADFAFFRAAEQGVRAHHWRFGDMPPVKGITRAETASIIAYLRRVQRENGIF